MSQELFSLSNEEISKRRRKKRNVVVGVVFCALTMNSGYATLASIRLEREETGRRKGWEITDPLTGDVLSIAEVVCRRELAPTTNKASSAQAPVTVYATDRIQTTYKGHSVDVDCAGYLQQNGINPYSMPRPLISGPRPGG